MARGVTQVYFRATVLHLLNSDLAFLRLEYGRALRSRSLFAYNDVSMSSRRYTPQQPAQKLTLDNAALCVFSSIVAMAGTPVSPALISPPNPLLFLLLWTFFWTLAPVVSSGKSLFTCSSRAGKGSVFSIVAWLCVPTGLYSLSSARPRCSQGKKRGGGVIARRKVARAALRGVARVESSDAGACKHIGREPARMRGYRCNCR